MLYGTVKGVEKSISRLALGTMIINSRELEKSFDLLDAAFEPGCTAFDTAHVYGSERPIGQWIKERGNRGLLLLIKAQLTVRASMPTAMK